jgi:hypothetical protein
MNYLRALCASLRALTIAALASATLGSAHAQPATDPDTAAWNIAREQNTLDAYQRYLELYPLGLYSTEAFQAIVELTLSMEGPAPPDAAVPGVDMY